MGDIFIESGLNINPYNRLANAIIIQAAKDYRKALLKDDKAEIYGLEHFFTSEWFAMLTDLDGDALYTEIKRSVLNENSKTKMRHLSAD